MVIFTVLLSVYIQHNSHTAIIMGEKKKQKIEKMKGEIEK